MMYSKMRTCSLETGSLIFAILNSIIVGLSSVASVAWVLGQMILMSDREAPNVNENLTLAGGGVMAMMLSFIAFAFSIVLAQGVFKILTGIASVISTVWLIGHVFWYFILGYSNAGSLLTDLLLTGIAAGTMIIAFTSCAFGVVLVKGILMKRPALIRAYFIYGVMVVCVCIASAMSLCALNRGFDVYVNCALIILGVCVIYSCILGIIWLNYRKFLRQSHHHLNWNLHYTSTTTATL